MPRPDGAMDVTIHLEGVRASHARDCEFVLFNYNGKAPFKVRYSGIIMQPHMVLKIYAKPQTEKLKRIRWAAQLKFNQREKFLIDEENKNLAIYRKRYGR